MKIKFKNFSRFGQIPTKARPGSACFDVFSSCEVKIRPGETKQIPLDIGFKFSKKFCCRIYPRSGLSLLPTSVGGGVVDSDYRGNISVILTNFSSSNVEVNIGDKIAQIIFVKPILFLLKRLMNFVIQQLEVRKVLVQLADNSINFFS